LALLLAFQPALSASKTRGAAVVVTQASGAQKGELIGVRESALILLTEAGDLTVEVAQIESVRIVKKASKIPVAIGFGIAGGAASYGLALASGVKVNSIGGGFALGVGVIAAGVVGGAIAGIAMADSLASDEVLVFKGRSESEVSELLTRLRSHARVGDYR
jgi:hypothetical protein